jgi:CheY-like chemotaxis protein
VQPRASRVSLEGARVLVLEDDAAVLSLIEFGLSARGATVVAARDMDEFTRILSRGVFDVALVDLSPMGSDPTTILRGLRGRPEVLPIVVISGSVAPEVPPDAVDAWVRKPFEISELADAISRVRRPE